MSILEVVYFNGCKSCQNYIKVKQENLFHRNIGRKKSFETGIFLVFRYSHPLSRLSIQCSKIVNTNHPIKIKHFHTLFVIYIWWPWSYGSWIYNYLCNQCLSPLKLWVRIPLRQDVLNTTLCDEVCQWLATGRLFSLCTPVSSTNKTDRHDITEILLKVALSTIHPVRYIWIDIKMFVFFPYFHKIATMFKTWQVDCLALKKLQITEVLLR